MRYQNLAFFLVALIVTLLGIVGRVIHRRNGTTPEEYTSVERKDVRTLVPSTLRSWNPTSSPTSGTNASSNLTWMPSPTLSPSVNANTTSGTPTMISSVGANMTSTPITPSSQAPTTSPIPPTKAPPHGVKWSFFFPVLTVSFVAFVWGRHRSFESLFDVLPDVVPREIVVTKNASDDVTEIELSRVRTVESASWTGLETYATDEDDASQYVRM